MSAPSFADALSLARLSPTALPPAANNAAAYFARQRSNSPLIHGRSTPLSRASASKSYGRSQRAGRTPHETFLPRPQFLPSRRAKKDRSPDAGKTPSPTSLCRPRPGVEDSTLAPGASPQCRLAQRRRWRQRRPLMLRSGKLRPQLVHQPIHWQSMLAFGTSWSRKHVTIRPQQRQRRKRPSNSHGRGSVEHRRSLSRPYRSPTGKKKRTRR